MTWASLHVHSQFSILDSTLSVEKIASLAKENQMPAIALTDSGNMFGAVDFYKACKEHKIKPIIGCELWLAHGSRFEKKKSTSHPLAYPIVLLAKNQIGYRNLCKLSSIGYVEGFYYHPRIDKEILEKHSEGLICLAGSLRSSIAHLILQGLEEELKNEVSFFSNLFKEDFYLELQRHFMKREDIEKGQMDKESWLLQELKEFVEKQEKVNRAIIEFSKHSNIKCVATNDVHYAKREDYKAHEILLNIQSADVVEMWEKDSGGNPIQRIPNPKRKIYPSHEFYFKSEEEIRELFKEIPEAVTNSLEIVDKCNFSFDFNTKHYPVFVPDTLKEGEDRKKSAESFLYNLCLESIDKRYTPDKLQKVLEKYPGQDPKEVVKKRFQYEYDILSSKGMSDYLLIVYDFIAWAKKRNIFVGPGRGSAAGSIISYLIGITDIEPLRFSLFFERFINPERISYPDIDVDICMDRRSEVIDYTVQKYGKDKVAQIITFGTMKAKMAIKDVGRVMSVPLAKVNTIAKLVPEDPNMTLDKALKLDPELTNAYENDEDTKMIIDLAKTLEGSIRNTSLHAAGLIISEGPLTNYVPVCTSKDSEMLVTQYAMKPVEMVGLLKIDFLGLKTLTSIEKTVLAVEQNFNQKIDWINLPLDDKNTFNLLNRGKTLGIFQIESGGMQELSKQLHIDNFEEIIAVVALYRPGPMDMIPSFIARKHGKEPIEIDHPFMKEILQETYGVMVYQEQVMQIASKLAGYSLGEGDVLRRAMGKKDKVEMTKQRDKFVQGSKKNNISEETAVKIFDKIEKFASYGFNKSHAAAYAYLAYVTAYLKANYPSEWMASLMTSDKDDLTKVAKFIAECKVLQIAILLPDINESASEFRATKNGIRFALSAIKGIGEGVALAIVEERKKGNFKSLYDFINRIDTSKVGKKNIELLIDAGAFDFTKASRDAMRENVEQIYEDVSRKQKEEAKGVLDIFSLLEENEEYVLPEAKRESAPLELLAKEKQLLGFYLSFHPMEKYDELLKKLKTSSLSEIEKTENNTLLRTAFIVDDIEFKISSKTQKKFAILTISDGIDRFELPIWSELCEKKGELLLENQLLYAILQVEKKEDGIKLQCRHLEDLTKIDSNLITSCDEIFSKLSKDHNKSDNKKRKMNKDFKEERKVALLKINVNADKMHLSQVMNIKSILKKNLGSTPVEIHFYSQNKPISILTLDLTLHIKYDLDLMSSLKELSCIVSMAIE
ncbi:MAG: DNA polymerase III subunit alpha [Chlamydiae bacterium]|nr:DNA polymerase III subunit alpha [Chlamydiota bacterium]